MILGFVKALKKYNINYQQQVLVDATDICDTCVYMTYIQLSLYGIPAVVHCGDTISQKMRFKLETPFYFLQYWKFSRFYHNNSNNEQEETSENNMVVDEETKNLFKEVTIKGNSQISLW